MQYKSYERTSDSIYYYFQKCVLIRISGHVGMNTIFLRIFFLIRLLFLLFFFFLFRNYGSPLRDINEKRWKAELRYLCLCYSVLCYFFDASFADTSNFFMRYNSFGVNFLLFLFFYEYFFITNMFDTCLISHFLSFMCVNILFCF